jgi:hypothetical protein
MDASKVGSLLPQQFGGILLGKLVAANMNSTADQIITIFSNPSKYVVRRVVVTNASLSLTTAVASVYTAASGGGSAVVLSQALSSLNASTRFLDCTLNSTGNVNTTVKSAVPNLYLKLDTAQGTASTADVYIYGDILEA